jgi:uncharacterized protein YtpQ (UPF0354 family)
LTLGTAGEKILPRLVPQGFLEASDIGATRVWRPLDQTGLVITYVIDRPSSLAYLSTGQLEELGLDPARLHERALDNLRRTFSVEAALDTLKKGDLYVLKRLDSHDAARVLVVQVAVMIPDTNTLALATVPADGDGSSLREACVPGDGKPLLNRPLRMTRSGFTLV